MLLSLISLHHRDQGLHFIYVSIGSGLACNVCAASCLKPSSALVTTMFLFACVVRSSNRVLWPHSQGYDLIRSPCLNQKDLFQCNQGRTQVTVVIQDEMDASRQRYTRYFWCLTRGPKLAYGFQDMFRQHGHRQHGPWPGKSLERSAASKQCGSPFVGGRVASPRVPVPQKLLTSRTWVGGRKLE